MSLHDSDGYCLRRVDDPQRRPGDAVRIQDLSTALVETTVEALPVAPESVSNIMPPALEVTRVDAHTADIKIIHGFRAHFRSSMKKTQDEEAFENCLIQAPGELLKRRVLHRGSLSFSDLTELDSACHDALDVPQRCQWEIRPSEIQLGRRIAVGGFAEVFVGRYQGTIVAVKRMFDRDAAAIEQFKKEITLLAKLRHPNLILFMGYCLTPELSIISEFMQKGCLYNILRAHDGIPLTQGYLEVVAVSVARGMAYLHTRQPPILHLDLKSPNILIDNTWRVKITDFGLSRLRNRTLVSGSVQGHGTPHWMSPEMIRGEKIDEKSDVYSYGVILWELLTGEVPWGRLNPIQVIAAVGFKHRQLRRPSHPDTLLVDLMERCLAADPQQRPSFPEILEILDGHYGQALTQKIAMLELTKGDVSTVESEIEPSSPVVGTVVEIVSTPATTSVEDSALSETPKATTRSVERLEAFEEKLRAERTVSVEAPTASPFAQLAATPLESSDDDPTETQSCDAALQIGANEAPSTDAATPRYYSPFAAYSAMPFVDSHSLDQDPALPAAETRETHESGGGTSTASMSQLRNDVGPFPHKSLKSQMSTVYDDASPPHTSGRDLEDVSFFHLDAPLNDSGWKIGVAEDEREEEPRREPFEASCSAHRPGPSGATEKRSSHSSDHPWSRESFDLTDDTESHDAPEITPSLGIPPMRFGSVTFPESP